MAPKKIKVINKKLQIAWDDDSESLIPLVELRKYCPCANCVIERKNRPGNYIPLLSTMQITLKDIKVIGNYALLLTWGDGHDEGIYSYEFLKAFPKL